MFKIKLQLFNCNESYILMHVRLLWWYLHDKKLTHTHDNNVMLRWNFEVECRMKVPDRLQTHDCRFHDDCMTWKFWKTLNQWQFGCNLEIKVWHYFFLLILNDELMLYNIHTLMKHILYQGKIWTNTVLSIVNVNCTVFKIHGLWLATDRTFVCVTWHSTRAPQELVVSSK